MATKPVVFTVGHSTRSLGDFIILLKAHSVQVVVDVRTLPRSRHNPQFNKETLRGDLKKAKIGYVHMKGLGGLRHARKDSINTAWRTDGFRGYADYMQTAEFSRNLKEIIGLAAKKRICLMCAESLPWRCHRSLISDALLVRRIHAKHIYSVKNVRPHAMTPFAKVRKTKITYPQ